MQAKEPPPSLEDLDQRLREAKARGDRAEKSAGERGRGLSFALRIGVELVAALMVGIGIGVLLDRWLGTTPWFLIVFFLFGAAAGILNVFRAMRGYGYAVGYRSSESKGASGRNDSSRAD